VQNFIWKIVGFDLGNFQSPPSQEQFKVLQMQYEILAGYNRINRIMYFWDKNITLLQLLFWGGNNKYFFVYKTFKMEKCFFHSITDS
jgi:hypothetical protein